MAKTDLKIEYARMRKRVHDRIKGLGAHKLAGGFKPEEIFQMFALDQQVSAVLVEEWNKFFKEQGMQFLEIKDTGIHAGIILKNVIDFKKLDITEFDLYQAGIYESDPRKLLADLVEDLRKIDYDEHVLEKEGSKILLNKFEIAVASALVLGAVCLAILHVMLPGIILLELGVAASLTAEVALIGLTAAFATGAAGKAAYDEITDFFEKQGLDIRNSIGSIATEDPFDIDNNPKLKALKDSYEFITNEEDSLAKKIDEAKKSENELNNNFDELIDRVIEAREAGIKKIEHDKETRKFVTKVAFGAVILIGIVASLLGLAALALYTGVAPAWLSKAAAGVGFDSSTKFFVGGVGERVIQGGNITYTWRDYLGWGGVTKTEYGWMSVGGKLQEAIVGATQVDIVGVASKICTSASIILTALAGGSLSAAISKIEKSADADLLTLDMNLIADLQKGIKEQAIVCDTIARVTEQIKVRDEPLWNYNPLHH